MYYLALILMGILPYYLFGKNFKNYSTLFLGLPLMGLSIYHFDDPTTASTVYKVLELMAFTTSVLTFFLSYRTLNLIKLSYYFVFVNVVALFIFKDKWMF
ncbi:MAG: hypothetical protein ACP5LI_07760, partial [Hydrogenobaculum sp.]